VRSFVFARRIDAPLARVHPLARTLLIFCLSAAQLRTIATAQSDLVGAILFWLLALAIFLSSGISIRIARLYFLLTLPTLFSLFMTWTILNTSPGVILFQLPVYSGQLALGLSLWQGGWLLLVLAYYLWRKRFLAGILLASLLIANSIINIAIIILANFLIEEMVLLKQSFWLFEFLIKVILVGFVVILFGEVIEAKAALDMGLAWRTVPGERLLAEAEACAARLAALPQHAVRHLKRALARSAYLPLEDVMAIEVDAVTKAFMDPATAARVADFRKQKPR